MANKKEIAPSLYSADVKAIADQVFNRRDGNCPILGKTNKSFEDILRNGKPNISASSIFIKKVNL
jgi:hypothetical protein